MGLFLQLINGDSIFVQWPFFFDGFMVKPTWVDFFLWIPDLFNGETPCFIDWVGTGFVESPVKMFFSRICEGIHWGR